MGRILFLLRISNRSEYSKYFKTWVVVLLISPREWTWKNIKVSFLAVKWAVAHIFGVDCCTVGWFLSAVLLVSSRAGFSVLVTFCCSLLSHQSQAHGDQLLYADGRVDLKYSSGKIPIVIFKKCIKLTGMISAFGYGSSSLGSSPERGYFTALERHLLSQCLSPLRNI